MMLKISDLSFEYPDGVKALENINLEIRDKNLIVLLGESGCGKTTLVKLICGFLDPKAGHIILNDEDITNLTTASRDLTMVFQNIVLYPHMTIYENVMTSFNGIKLSEDEKDERVKNILTQFGLRNYLNFKPRNLSLGQKQRVAICKALVRKPALFILDEPLSNVDVPQKKAILKELKQLYEKMDSSYIYVTHDIEDAEYLSTYVVLLDKGKAAQTGRINDIKDNPNSLKVANLIYNGLINCIERSDTSPLSKLFESKKNSQTLCIPYKGIKIHDSGEFSGKFLSAKITPKGIQLSLRLENGDELSILVDEEEIPYKENDIVHFDVVKSFLF